MRLPALLVLLGSLSAVAGEPDPAFVLHDGDRVVFYGDSITQDGAYARFVEEYARSRFPQWDLRFYNAGVGGDTVKGGGGGEIGVRLERDVIRLKPTVVTVMLGMNDGRYRKLEPATLAGFTEGYRAIVEKLKSALPGVRLYLLRSSPFDDISRPPVFDPGYDDVLRRLGDAVSSIGLEQHAQVVDFGSAVDDGIRAVWKEDRELARQVLTDRVHPAAAGHIVMGTVLLRAWRAPALVARVEIDAKAAKVVAAQNSVVSSLAVAGGNVTWSELDASLPLPRNFADADTELAQKAGADLESLDAEPMAVTGLTHGRYELRIDGEIVGTFSDAELASGVNLARYNTPMRWQAYKVRWGADSGHQEQRVRRELLVASTEAPGLVAAADILAAREESEQLARSRSANPKLRQFSLASVP
ncbi:MAG TPA: SGNH/GDSL hydrolase family protein [Opitutaceae bacterium]|nr:SGNH/GDSL hydrolase family protein [Opitutaceae bacterium]